MEHFLTNYKILKKLGYGSFGEVYKIIHKITKEEYALKLEKKNIKQPQLHEEYKIYQKCLESVEVYKNFLPKVYSFLRDDQSTMMIMDLLGPSIEVLFEYCSRKFTLKTILMIAIQMIQNLEFLHFNGFLHRDLKPENFVMGSKEYAFKIYLIDYGLCKPFRLLDGSHIPIKYDKSLVGTARYVSLNVHKGKEPSRRDDLISLGYIFVYLLTGTLPWSGLPARTKLEKFAKISQMKQHFNVDQLFLNQPLEFQEYLNYVIKLKFDETPDYEYLQNIFFNLMEKEQYEMDFDYDWYNSQASKIIKKEIKASNQKQVCFNEIVKEDEDEDERGQHEDNQQ